MKVQDTGKRQPNKQGYFTNNARRADKKSFYTIGILK